MENKHGRVEFTKAMKKDYTILIPNMAPIHFNLIKNVFTNHGYRAVLLENNGPQVVQEGLKYVHNDMCYPALLVIGQMIDALNSGLYDPDKTALVISQTGGGCRASNYIFLLRKALQRAGYEQIPVISLNLKGLERNPGFKLTVPMLLQAFAGLIYGDLLMLLKNQVRPYEVDAGSADALVERWIETLSAQFKRGRGWSFPAMRRNLAAIVESFARIEIKHVPKVKVGIVGEIYMKYASLGNNNLEQLLADEDCEVMLPGILGFIMYGCDNSETDRAIYGGRFWTTIGTKLVMKLLKKVEGMSIDAVKRFPQFLPPAPYTQTKALDDGVIGYGCKMGEGWLLTAEMLELAENGYANIVCTQPFGCLPNHICGKGMIRKIKEKVPHANIVPIDYDPSATHVNQENRIKLMLAVAREELQKVQAESSG
ncbi:MAG: 2-hydroxyglutaryl-CoA dehydratase [Sphaerochaetaceae bacterium]|jgi:predicted nucleotide-binding protein (sugar kinase/HSP70/actin superfamily)